MATESTLAFTLHQEPEQHLVMLQLLSSCGEGTFFLVSSSTPQFSFGLGQGFPSVGSLQGGPGALKKTPYLQED